jgi:hypothetical protein
MNLKLWGWVCSANLTTGLYVTFVAQCLWNWFLTDFGVPVISYWRMCGLILLINLILQARSEEADTTFQEAVAKSLKEAWVIPALKVFDKLLRATLALGVGWCIHALLI